MPRLDARFLASLAFAPLALAPLATAAHAAPSEVPAPADAAPSESTANTRVFRLEAGAGLVDEIGTYHQTMGVFEGTVLVRWDMLLVGADLATHTTVSNDTKTDLDLRLGAAFDLSPEWELAATASLGRRAQTKGRLEGVPELLGSDIPGTTHAFGVAGLDVGLRHRSATVPGFEWGLEAFARADLVDTFQADTTDGGPKGFGGTFEVGLTLRIGVDFGL